MRITGAEVWLVEGGMFRFGERPGLGFDLIEEEIGRHPGITAPRQGFYI